MPYIKIKDDDNYSYAAYEEIKDKCAFCDNSGMYDPCLRVNVYKGNIQSLYTFTASGPMCIYCLNSVGLI